MSPLHLISLVPCLCRGSSPLHLVSPLLSSPLVPFAPHQSSYLISLAPRLLAIGFLHTQFFRGSGPHRLSDVQPYHDNDICCSVKDNISKPWTEPSALSLNIQVRVLPVNQPPTCYNPSYSPKMAVVTIHPWFPRESRHRCLHGVIPSQNKKEKQGSGTKNVSEQQTVPWALSPYMQVKSLPVTTNSRPNAFENACPSFLQPQKGCNSQTSCASTNNHHLDVLGQHQRDAKWEKWSNLPTILAVSKGLQQYCTHHVEMGRSAGNTCHGAFVPGIAMVLFWASARQLKLLRAAQSHKLSELSYN